MNDNENDGGFWTGLIVGGLLGSVAGFFLGGDDKNELKKRLKDKAFDVWDNLGSFTETVKDKVEEIKDEAEEIKDNAVEEAEEVEQKAQEVAVIAREKIKSIADSAQQAVDEQVAEVKKTVGESSGIFKKKFFFRGGRPMIKTKNPS